MPVPEILIVAPPPARAPKGTIAPKFEAADAKGKGLAEALADVAAELGCAFFAAGRVVQVSAIDGVHLEADQHLVLARALANEVAALARANEAPSARATARTEPADPRGETGGDESGVIWPGDSGGSPRP